MAIEIVDFPSYKMVDLSIAMLIYQRVYRTSLRALQSNPTKVCWIQRIQHLGFFAFVWVRRQR